MIAASHFQGKSLLLCLLCPSVWPIKHHTHTHIFLLFIISHLYIFLCKTLPFPQCSALRNSVFFILFKMLNSSFTKPYKIIHAHWITFYFCPNNSGKRLGHAMTLESLRLIHSSSFSFLSENNGCTFLSCSYGIQGFNNYLVPELITMLLNRNPNDPNEDITNLVF